MILRIKAIRTTTTKDLFVVFYGIEVAQPVMKSRVGCKSTDICTMNYS